ncbi:HNH endonuclease [Halorubrum ezzemoulense]|uniref:HNH nuclease domain-containing protein n=1 Tax=Halorubrum ezzemoulense TaxID=337243 RepID=A0A256JWR3_HALEZ|nr:HNH endonuclease [Halorubrum ezzemoulense]OYR72812.1 hypothetical protein DJ78_01905 [Halorubrum ezzemoulense]
MAASSYPDDWDERRRKVYSRDNYTCQQCGARGGSSGDTELHAHHLTPRSEGGSDSLDNLQTLCVNCHNSQHKHDITRDTTQNDQQDTVNNHLSRVYTILPFFFFVVIKHLIAPLAAGYGYFYILSEASSTAGSIHWLLTPIVLLVLGTTGGILGLRFQSIVFKSYLLVFGILAWYVSGQDPTFIERLGRIMTDAHWFEALIAIPTVLFGLFGPLLITLGTRITGTTESNRIN